jgi:hypothetical protein
MDNDIYTSDEYYELADMLPSSNLSNNILYMVRHQHSSLDSRITSIDQFIKNDFGSISTLFFEIPLKLLPLLVNTEHSVIRTIALWRLKIGK